MLYNSRVVGVVLAAVVAAVTTAFLSLVPETRDGPDSCGFCLFCYLPVGFRCI